MWFRVCVCVCVCVHVWRWISLEKWYFQKGVSVDGYNVGLGGWLGSGWGLLGSVPFVGEAGTVRTSLSREDCKAPSAVRPEEPGKRRAQPARSVYSRRGEGVRRREGDQPSPDG